MDQSPENPVSVTPVPPALRLVRKIRRFFRCGMAVVAGFLPLHALAQTPGTNTDIVAQLRQELGPILTIGLNLLLVGGFATAGYIIITGAIRVMNDREGGLARFGLGILVAIIMIAFTVYLVGQGDTAINEITGGSTS